MTNERDHAFLSASSAHRWLECTAAPAFEQTFPEGETSVYAREGTLAHSVAEITASLRLGKIKKTEYEQKLAVLKEDELYSPEMLATADVYADYIVRQTMQYTGNPYTALEVRVDFSAFVQNGFGTSDCIIIGGDTIHVVDYKHGKGVLVSAAENPQMRLYALGALAKYKPIFGDAIRNVKTAIIQPRISEEASEESISVEDLMTWGEEYVKPRAEKAYTGEGAEYKPGDWCRFCAGRQVCRARAEYYLNLEAHVGEVPTETLSPEQLFEIDKAKVLGLPHQNTLSDKEVGEILHRAEALAVWVEDLSKYALTAILDGREIPGYRVVEGRSTRAWTDQDAALDALKNSGIDEALIYDRKAKSLSELEKLVGKKQFNALVGGYIEKPAGKPVLVIETDKRPDYNSAALDAAALE